MSTHVPASPKPRTSRLVGGALAAFAVAISAAVAAPASASAFAGGLPAAGERSVIAVDSPGELSAAADFAIRGAEARYEAGDTMRLQVSGVDLKPGQTIEWGYTGAGRQWFTPFAGAVTHTPLSFERPVTTSYDGIKVQARVVDFGPVATTEAVSIVVGGPDRGTGEPVTVSRPAQEATLYAGDAVPLTAAHRPLRDGESLRWVWREKVKELEWVEVRANRTPRGAGPTFVTDAGWNADTELALEIVDSTGTVGRSAALHWETSNREVLLSGVAGTYYAGQTVTARASLTPDRAGVSWRWTFDTGTEIIVLADRGGAEHSFTAVSQMRDGVLSGEARDAVTNAVVARAVQRIAVADAPSGAQTITMAGLSDHQHQGTLIQLRATTFPVLADRSKIQLWWKRPDQPTFTQIDAVVDGERSVRAQQALDDTLVMARLVDDTGAVVAESEPVTINIDDHGAPPAERATLVAPTSPIPEGELFSLSAQVTPDSVLSRWEWWLQAPGAAAPTIIEGQHGSTVDLRATAELHGSSVFARLGFNDGRPYVETPAHSIAVAAASVPAGPDAGPAPSPLVPSANGPGGGTGTIQGAVTATNGASRVEAGRRLAATGGSDVSLWGAGLLLAVAGLGMLSRRRRATR